MPTHHTQSRGSHPTSRYNKNYSGSAESEEIALLKNKYSSELPTLRELFPTWSEEDILFTLQENQGDLMLTIDRISEGFATQWDEVKTAKPKKEAPFTTSNTRNQQQQFVQDKTKHKGKILLLFYCIFKYSLSIELNTNLFLLSPCINSRS
ncbi:hypothetical protein CONCODRAFT_107775 [Conidiobolus coronatus NRRL 28638]|uniref:RNA polymerase II degradation factor 1 n=1 Tax=Conidiobolus coronatus (strain ATCC 28846 / CBS 209.66 / NRRL 28638) TaxID=796925 RepID=A0A137NZA1_CONC2|nr:hypothetical protein CONCODRAFT_107775 [Conidiobolus coronatus NRRL 28638]|eukprot:KXN68163.1 hypothetical protein CONCODRAFT_107775 [Conidiobolus coronatus NRRL 28638]